MILTLAGTVTHKDAHFVVLENGGVGYQVFMGPSAISTVSTGSELRVWTHDHIKEDGRDLFGFLTLPEYKLFMKLIGISGVGPRSALNMMALGPVKDIEANIEKADVDWLTRVPGIGKKTAQKIVLELKGKLAIDGGDDEEVLTALTNLGYARDKAREALATVGAGQSVEERLRSALRTLGR